MSSENDIEAVLKKTASQARARFEKARKDDLREDRRILISTIAFVATFIVVPVLISIYWSVP